MANGRLGVSMSAANNNVTVYTVPVTAAFATISMHILNIDASESADVNLYLSTSDSPGVGDLIDKATITAGGQLMQSCRLASAGEKVILWSDKPNILIRVEGLEESI